MTKDAAFISGLKEALRIIDEYDREDEALCQRFKLKRRNALAVTIIRNRIEAFVSDVEALGGIEKRGTDGKQGEH